MEELESLLYIILHWESMILEGGVLQLSTIKGTQRKPKGREPWKNVGGSLAVGSYLQRGSAPPPPPGLLLPPHVSVCGGNQQHSQRCGRYQMSIRRPSSLRLAGHGCRAEHLYLILMLVWQAGCTAETLIAGSSLSEGLISLEPCRGWTR